jgi:hypothetical protein
MASFASAAARAALVIAALGGLAPSRALATQAVEAGFLPISLSQPLGYEEAYKGIGLYFGANLFLERFNGGFGLSYLTQGKGSATSVTYRQYLLGRAQAPAPNLDAASLDTKANPMLGEFRYYGLYLEVGGTIFQMQTEQNDLNAQGNPTGTVRTISKSGTGVIGGLGFEYPVLSFLFTSAKISLMSTLGGPANQIFVQLGVGYPLDLF